MGQEFGQIANGMLRLYPSKDRVVQHFNVLRRIEIGFLVLCVGVYMFP